jgi:hypothetical protein
VLHYPDDLDLTEEEEMMLMHRDVNMAEMPEDFDMQKAEEDHYHRIHDVRTSDLTGEDF